MCRKSTMLQKREWMVIASLTCMLVCGLAIHKTRQSIDFLEIQAAMRSITHDMHRQGHLHQHRQQESQKRVGMKPPVKWFPPALPEHLESADQDNEALISHILNNVVIEPYPRGQLNLRGNLTHYSQWGQSKSVDELLGNQTGGFFLECGAADGEHISNSLFFEKSRNWTGLLVEASPEVFEQLLQKRRHAYMVNACLSPHRYPVRLQYNQAGLMGGLDLFMTDIQRQRVGERFQTGTEVIQCFPLMSILKAVYVNRIDYFSLDIEGPEIEVLQTMSFDQISIGVLSVEYRVPDRDAREEKLMTLRHMLVDTNGYQEVNTSSPLDVVFTKSDI